MADTSSASGKRVLPLAGVRIADFSRLLPGPWCSQLLGDFGADVIKVEQPGIGDYSRHNPPAYKEGSVYFHSVNGNKRSLALDLAKPEGLAVAQRLFRTSDAVIESFRPGVPEKLEIDYASARKLNPKLVYCSISGYGQDGPLARVPGHDLVIQSMTGLMGMNLDRDLQPTPPGFLAGDYAGAAMATIGVMAGLMQAKQTGEGCYIDLSMFDSLFYMNNIVLTGAMARLAGQPGLPMLQAFGGNPRYNVYLCKDGKPVAVSLLEARQWKQFCEVIGRTDMIFADEGPDSRLSDHGARSELFRDTIRDFCASMDRKPLLALMEQHQIPIAPVNTPDEALAEPVVAARGLVSYTEHPSEGRIPHLVSPYKRAGLTRDARKDAPGLGEDSDAVLRDLGYRDDEIAKLRKSGVVTS
jgi:CoA:oxalate CoA-transferase